MANTYADIQRQIAVLQKKAAEARKGELSKVIATIKKQITRFGLSPEDLFNGSATASPVPAAEPAVKKAANPPKYRDPNTGKTWTGLGKAPGWLVGAMEAGRADKFLIARLDGESAGKATAKVAMGSAAAKTVTTKATLKKPVDKAPVKAAVAKVVVSPAPRKAAAAKSAKAKPVGKGTSVIKNLAPKKSARKPGKEAAAVQNNGIVEGSQSVVQDSAT
jgi:DNA-binding protein H-NS